MKPHERRQVGAYPYYVLAKWNDKLQCFQDSKKTYVNVQNAVRKAEEKRGRYRVSQVNEKHERLDFTPFEIG